MGWWWCGGGGGGGYYYSEWSRGWFVRPPRTPLAIHHYSKVYILDYNDVYYFLLNEDKQRKLQAMQNRALRIIFKDRHYHVNEMHELANLSTLMVRRKVHMAGLMYKRSKNSFYHDTRNLPLRQFDKVVLRTPVDASVKLMIVLNLDVGDLSSLPLLSLVNRYGSSNPLPMPFTFLLSAFVYDY